MSACQGLVDSCPNALSGASAQVFLSLINALFAAKCEVGGEYPKDRSSALRDQEAFDFIIVGAGSAGCVVANKLSENPNWKILLIEAGTTPSSTSEIPALLDDLKYTAEDWQYQSEPQAEACIGSRNGRCSYPRGKCLGGSSTINAMLYYHGQRQDYDEWAAAGNPGWDWDSIFPFFLESEKLQNGSFCFNSSNYGINGLLSIKPEELFGPIYQVSRDAGAELGLPSMCGEGDLGYITTLQTVTADGFRANTAKEFLGPIRDRPNLIVAQNALTTKVLVKSLRARGVQVLVKNKTLTLWAKKEVILSAGSINTPQLLMLSGIGPKAHLRDLGITVEANLNVGDNFQDHPAFPGIFAKVSEKLTPRIDPLDAAYELFAHGRGALTSSFGYTFAGFVNFNNSTRRSVELPSIAHPVNDTDLGILIDFYGLSQEVGDIISAVNAQSPLVSIVPFYLHPLSRGNVRLRSTNPRDSPKIIPNFLQREEDVQGLLDTVRYVQRFFATKAFSSYHPEIADLRLPQCTDETFDTDDYWRCHFKVFVTSGFHPVGTCKMGPNTDPTAVVDSRLRVHNLTGLRVIDASIMPSVTGCNTNGPTIMIGQKGATMVIEDWTS